MNDKTTTMEQTTEVPAAPLPSVQVEQKALLAALGRAVVWTHGPKPILAAVQLRAADALLHVTGCNGEITTDEVVNARCDTLGVFPPVNLKDFTALIRKQKGVVTLTALPGFQVQVNGAMTMTGFDPADYPPLPTQAIEPVLQLDGPEFIKAAEAALKHASRETSRYAINGVLIERNDNGTRLCATDGRRLLVYPLKTADGPWQGSVIVTRAHLAEAIKAVKTGKAARVLVRMTPICDPGSSAVRMVQFSAGGMWLGWSLELEGNFPQYGDVIPARTAEDAWIIGKGVLRDAVAQAATVSDDENRCVRLHFSGTCDVFAKGCGGSAELSVPCRYAGDVQGVDMMIGVNPAFLLDALDAIPGEDVRVQARNMNHAMRVETPELDGPCVVVMPIGIETPDGWEPLPADAIKQAGEHWNVTRAEFAELDWFQRVYGKLEGANLDAALSLHKQSVRVALRLGKPVPANVLAEYPDLTAAPVGEVVVVPDPDAEPAPVAESQVEPAAEPVQVEANAVLAERLEKLADGLQKEIDAKRAPRRENTPKQAREAMSARLDADDLERGQRALRLLARLWRAGQVPALLAGLRSKLAILPLVRHRIVSNGYYHVGDSGEYADASDVGRLLQELLDRNATAEEKEIDAKAKRDAQLREALNEVKFLKIDGYFPTPPAVAEKMLELAQIKPGHLVLEPSAGTGELAEAIRLRVPFTDQNNLRCIEVCPRFVEILKLRGFQHVSCADFLECQGLTDYDRIVMNPPFENMQDIDHVRHAYTLLRPGGRLVSVMSAGTFHGVNRKRVEFCQWLKSMGGEVFDLPAGAFEISGTGVFARLIVVDKPEEPDEQEGYAPRSELTPEEADQLAEARAKKAAEAQAEPEKPTAPPKETVAEWLATLKWAKPSKMSKPGKQCACCGQPIAKGEIVQLAWVPVYRNAAHAK